MDRQNFAAMIEVTGPEVFVIERLAARNIAAFKSADQYAQFRRQAAAFFGDEKKIFVMGSGNYGYSLNPIKHFQQFNEKSDIDLVVISQGEFYKTWNEMRLVHRKVHYELDHAQRRELLDKGRSIYCGFISPEWIPAKGNPVKFNFLRLMNELSSELVSFRRVNARFFRAEEEVVDYYKRGVMLALEGAK